MSDSDDARRTSARNRNAGAQQLTVDVASRAQHLVESRRPGPYQLGWCQEALYVGDLTALAAVSLRRPGVPPESDRV